MKKSIFLAICFGNLYVSSCNFIKLILEAAIWLW